MLIANVEYYLCIQSCPPNLTETQVTRRRREGHADIFTHNIEKRGVFRLRKVSNHDFDFFDNYNTFLYYVHEKVKNVQYFYSQETINSRKHKTSATI